jgi:hypothetical protein
MEFAAYGQNPSVRGIVPIIRTDGLSLSSSEFCCPSDFKYALGSVLLRLKCATEMQDAGVGKINAGTIAVPVTVIVDASP